MSPMVEITVVNMGGEVVRKQNVAAGQVFGAFRDELASSLGFPPAAVRILDGGNMMGDEDLFDELPSQRLLTCVFMSAPLSTASFLQAAREGQHGLVRAMLRTAGASERKQLLVADGAVRKAALFRGTGAAEILLKAAEEDGILAQCLMQKDHSFSTTALHHAAARGPEQVRLLLSAAESQGMLKSFLAVHNFPDGETALHCAARGNQPEVVEMLLRCAVQEHVRRQLLTARDSYGFTALHVAANLAHAAVFRMLLEAAAEEGGYLLEELLAARTWTFKARTLREMAADDAKTDGALKAVVAANPTGPLAFVSWRCNSAAKTLKKYLGAGAA